MNRFRVVQHARTPLFLSFGLRGEVTIVVDRFGRVAHTTSAPEPPFSTAEEYARLAIPIIIERYRTVSGLRNFGTPTGARREAMLQYVADALNEGV